LALVCDRVEVLERLNGTAEGGGSGKLRRKQGKTLGRALAPVDRFSSIAYDFCSETSETREALRT